MEIPKSTRANSPGQAANNASKIGFPLALKGEGFAHKTEANAVVLNILSKEQVIKDATRIDSTSFLLEEMITDNIVELLVGVVRDPAHGFILSLSLIHISEPTRPY